MDDRALLELAAKAAGIETAFWNDGQEVHSSGEGFILPSNRLWNPLTDDGDALRLAVKLALNIDIQHHETEVFTWDGVYLASEHVFVHPAHAYEATRLAIVTAAAKLGKES